MELRLEPRRALGLVRVAVASLLFVHGGARVALGIVDDFGTFLGAAGLPLGPALAWLITLVELVGAPTLAAGRGVVALCAWFSLQLLAGIALVHAPSGWFVVGAGRNGMEYSALLILCLAAVALGQEPTAPGDDLEGPRDLSAGDRSR